MNRLAFTVVLGGALAATHRTVRAQDGLDGVRALVQARDQAANDLRQVHLLAKYTQGNASAPPIDVRSIDVQYDTMAAAINGYLTELATAIDLNQPLGAAKVKSDGDAAIAKARALDDSLQALRNQYGSSDATRGNKPQPTAVMLVQAFSRTSTSATILASTGTSAAEMEAAKRKEASNALLALRWPNAAAVLSPSPSPAPPEKP